MENQRSGKILRPQPGTIPIRQVMVFKNFAELKTIRINLEANK